MPEELHCATRFAQNSTHVLLVVRFSKTWDGPSARWGQRYSTVGGSGQLEQDTSFLDDLERVFDPTWGGFLGLLAQKGGGNDRIKRIESNFQHMF